MKLLALVISALFIFAGCTQSPVKSDVAQVVQSNPTDLRVNSLGIVRIRSTYSLASGNFRSTCSGTLLHGGDQSLRECVVLSAAHCFKNFPRGTEHNVEFTDPKGNVQKVFPVSSVQIHPAFTASDAKLSMAHAAVDAALLKFMCALPASIKSARIAEFSQVPMGSSLITTKFVEAPEADRANEEKEKVSESLLSALPVTSARLTQLQLRLRSVDFPSPPDTEKQVMPDFVGPLLATPLRKTSNLPGLLSLEGKAGQGSCEIDAGAPVLFDNGRELLLVGSTTAGTGNCDVSPARATLTSSLVKWMEEVVGEGVISVVDRANHSEISPTPPQAVAATTAIPTSSFPPLPTQPPLDKSLVGISTGKTISTEKIEPLETEMIEKVIPKRVTTIKPPVSTPKVALKANVLPPKPTATATPKAFLPPLPDEDLPDFRVIIPPLPESDEPEEKVVRVCNGRKWGVNAKTRVWGTVIKLVDKDANLITDDKLKCELPNETELCLVSHPVSTGTGSSRAELQEDVDVGGCEKFKAGESIFIYLPDFMPR
ncbi:MAG: hypothetical protein RI932_2213 [Pseudomonadota bacterium]|jgi:hypothetical protein